MAWKSSLSYIYIHFNTHLYNYEWQIYNLRWNNTDNINETKSQFL